MEIGWHKIKPRGAFMTQLEDYYEEDFPDEIEGNEPEEKQIDFEYSLSSYGIDFDIAGLVRRYKEKSIYIPKFQRNYVWTIKKASRFIESLLLGLPVPGIFLYKEEETQKLMIVDGLQRIETLKSFYDGRIKDRVFKLIDVTSSLLGKSIDLLTPELRRKLDDAAIHATIIKADEPKAINFNGVYEIFERLNTGGMNLHPQEIRACIFHGDFQGLLALLASDVRYRKLLNIDEKRKKDQEIILRLFALIYNYDNYNGNMKQFLNDFMEDNASLAIHTEEELKNIFNKTIEIFVKNIPEEVIKPNKGQLNLSIFDAIFVGIAKNILSGKMVADAMVASSVDNLLHRDKFNLAITTGRTHHTDSVKNRIDEAIDAFGSHK